MVKEKVIGTALKDIKKGEIIQLNFPDFSNDKIRLAGKGKDWLTKKILGRIRKW